MTLTQMTLILKLDLDMVKMYHNTKNEVSLSTHSKATAQTGCQTDTTKHERGKGYTIFFSDNPFLVPEPL